MYDVWNSDFKSSGLDTYRIYSSFLGDCWHGNRYRITNGLNREEVTIVSVITFIGCIIAPCVTLIIYACLVMSGKTEEDAARDLASRK